MTVNTISRFVAGVLSAIGLFGVMPIAYRHATGLVECPVLGSVVACYVVLLGYALTGASVFLRRGPRLPVFVAGWIPVFGLALTASSMEALGNEVCPRGAYDVPTCYFSLALTISLIAAMLVERFYRPK